MRAQTPVDLVVGIDFGMTCTGKYSQLINRLPLISFHRRRILKYQTFEPSSHSKLARQTSRNEQQSSLFHRLPASGAREGDRERLGFQKPEC